MAKFMKGWKKENFFSVDANDLKSMSFKFGNDIFINFEMPRSSYLMHIWKINISYALEILGF